jgi:hypothetical protein
LCVEGTQASSADSSCEPCPSEGQAAGLSVGLSIVLAVVLIIVFAILWRSEATSIQLLKPDRSEMYDADDHEISIWTPNDLYHPSIINNLKILLSYMQICVNLLDVVEVSWPNSFKTFIGYFSFVNLSFIPWNSVACLTSITYYTQLLVVSVLPVCIILVVCLVLILPLTLMERADTRDSETVRFFFCFSFSLF